MDAGRIFGRGIAFPPRVGADGRIAWSQGETNIREAIEVILKTERARAPGPAVVRRRTARFLFEPNTVATRQQIADRIQRALRCWEPRITLSSRSTSTTDADRSADRRSRPSPIGSSPRARASDVSGARRARRVALMPITLPTHRRSRATTTCSRTRSRGYRSTPRSGRTSTVATRASRSIEVFAFLTESCSTAPTRFQSAIARSSCSCCAFRCARRRPPAVSSRSPTTRRRPTRSRWSWRRSRGARRPGAVPDDAVGGRVAGRVALLREEEDHERGARGEAVLPTALCVVPRRHAGNRAGAVRGRSVPASRR